MGIPSTIFREYDIRGIVGKDLTVEHIRTVAKAYGTRMVNQEAKRIAIGRDMRPSSSEFRDAWIDTLTGLGLDTLDVGVCPTPLLYYTLFSESVDGGIMITGSHNPKAFNGFKVCVGRDTIHGEAIQDLRRSAEKGDFAPEIGGGRRSALEIIPKYIAAIGAQFAPLRERINRRPMKIVLDSGNGTAGLVAPELIRRLGCEVVELYSEPDGNFPNHHPDPTVTENLADLIATVRKTGALLGIGYDGDADRIGVVDETGEILWGDRLMILFARRILRDEPGATFVSEVKCSQTLYDEIEKAGGRAIMWKAGHSLIKAKMRETQAALGGEMSGHIFFKHRFFGFDDAIYASCRLIEILVETGKPLSTLLADVPRMIATPEIRLDCPDAIKFAVVERLTAEFKKTNKVIDIDGARILFDGGWGLVRASNTQPALVLRAEADSEAKMEKIRRTITERVAVIQGALQGGQ